MIELQPMISGYVVWLIVPVSTRYHTDTGTGYETDMAGYGEGNTNMTA